jgi:hypothetical protein
VISKRMTLETVQNIKKIIPNVVPGLSMVNMPGREEDGFNETTNLLNQSVQSGLML